MKRENLIYSSDDGTLVFALGKGWHNGGIVMNDMAGNTNNIQEKANVHIGFFWLLIFVVSFISAIAIIAFITVRNMRKNRDLEND